MKLLIVGFPHLQKSFEQGTAYEFALFLKESGRYIGNCGLVTVSKTYKNAEVGDSLMSHNGVMVMQLKPVKK